MEAVGGSTPHYEATQVIVDADMGNTAGDNMHGNVGNNEGDTASHGHGGQQHGCRHNSVGAYNMATAT